MLSVYVFPLIFNAIFGLALALFVARRGSVPGARALLVLILAAAEWSICYAMEFVWPDLSGKVFWAKLQYFGITAIPLAWAAFAEQAARRAQRPALSPRVIAALALIPALTLLLVWTNESHGLVWSRVQLQAGGGVAPLEIEHGPWFWVYVAYGYLLLVWGSYRWLGTVFGSVLMHRWYAVLALLAVLIAWLGNLVYVSEGSPVEHVDLTPFGFTIAGLLLAVTLIRFRLVDILPIAQRAVFAGLADEIFVLDREGAIVDLNPAALQMIGGAGPTPLGRPLSDAAGELAPWLERCPFDQECCFDFARGGDADKRYYELRVTPLAGPSRRPIGRLVVCHEITELKQQQARLEQMVSERTEELRTTVEQLERELDNRTQAEQAQNRLMEQITQSHEQLRAMTLRLEQVRESERRQIAAELHDCVGQNLTALNLNLQMVGNQLDARSSSPAASRLADSLKLVEETTRDVRTLMADLHPPVLDEYGLVPALTWYAGVFSQRSGIAAHVSGDFESRLSSNAELVLFRLVQEALNNVAKHAHATQVTISAQSTPEAECLQVADNGDGFDAQTRLPGDEPHWGLISMQQRADLIGGKLVIDSAPGSGTRVILTLRRHAHEKS